MAIPTLGVALAAIALGYALSPSESADAGKRVESATFTEPVKAARCITYNINKKRPDLLVRNRPSDSAAGSIYLVLSNVGATPSTYGVIRIDENESGSHLTTWLSGRTLADASASEVAQKLVAGC